MDTLGFWLSIVRDFTVPRFGVDCLLKRERGSLESKLSIVNSFGGPFLTPDD